jgi:mRNA-degrading endonuclease toxin of MazEF toxin-antitoxin module
VFGEVHICQFPHTSGAPGKVRPVLVLFDLGADALVCRVTSVPRSAAGLLKPSVARLDRLLTAEKTIFLRRLGTLSRQDAQAVRSAWNKHMTL